MSESVSQNFNHLKIHTQYSICEGAARIDDLQEYSKKNKIKSLGLCDTSNLCGALEFAEKISKSGTQPIIGTQINIKIGETIGLLPLFALNEAGYKNIIELSSLSYLENDELSDPHVDFELLLSNSKGVAVFSGTVFGLFGKLFDKGKFSEIDELYNKIKNAFDDRFYLEIQRHNDQNEIGFEKFNLKKSIDLEIPIIATNEVFYLDKEMHEAHDALICIGNKTYVNEKNRLRFTDQHYLKTDNEKLPVNVFMGVDPASSIRKTADYSVIMPIAVDNKNNRYVLEYYRKRATPMNLAESIIEYFKLYKPVKVRIESVGYQEMLREYLRQRTEEENLFISGLEIKEAPRTSKSSRLETMEPYFAQKKMYIKKDQLALKDELLLYPRGKHDDLLDGLYYAMKKCYPPFHKEEKKDKGELKYSRKSDDISWKIA